MQVYGFGDPSAPAGPVGSSSSCPRPPYGPWAPPVPEGAGRIELDFEHAYDEPGSYTAKFYFTSRDNRICVDPYGSTAGAAITVTVRGA
jgi:hypothetical protein